MQSRQKINLTSDITVGTGDASDEIELLKTVFIDTGYAKQLQNVQNPKCIILGPTGVGKTALINHLTDSIDNILQIHPDDLSITYIHSSSIIQDMERCGVNLAPVFRFMWQHVFLVEFIRLKFELNSKVSITKWIDRLKSQYLPESNEYQAVHYMEKWNHNIWESVNLRVQEMTNSLEAAVKGKFGLGSKEIGQISTELSGTELNEKKEKYESIVQTYISQELIKEQQDIMKMCKNNFFSNKNKPYYIVIDDLDKDWAPNDLKGLLLKSLLMAIKHLKRIPNVKIIIALREDIKHHLFHETPTPGFQEDKFESLEVRLIWSTRQLKNLANARINNSYKSTYTNASVRLEQIFNSFQIDKKTPIDYIISRTRFRPRELILFLNTCIERASSENHNQITRTSLLAAEKRYSSKRIQSVHDEWGQVYPCIKLYFNLLRRKPAVYSVGRFLQLNITEFSNEIVTHDLTKHDPIGARMLQENGNDLVQLSDRKILRELVKVFYQCGIVGMNISSELPIIWSFIDDPLLDDTSFDTKAKMHIHPAFYSALGINKKDENKVQVSSF